MEDKVTVHASIIDGDGGKQQTFKVVRTGPDTRGHSRQSKKTWVTINGDLATVHQLYEYSDDDPLHEYECRRRYVMQSKRAIMEVIYDAVDACEREYPEVARILKMLDA